jgi:transcriptional regulator with XRE-family HTH domain
MAKRKVELDKTGNTVRANVVRFRGLRRMTLRDMATRMTDAGRPMSHATINEIEHGARRIDVDDLAALAIALQVSVPSLLMPPVTDEADQIEDAVTGAPVSYASSLWEWLTAQAPPNAWPVYGRPKDEFEIERWRRDATPPWTWRNLRAEEGVEDGS